MRYRVLNEYIDNTLGRRIGVGEELDLTTDRERKIKAIGVGLELIQAPSQDPADENDQVPATVSQDDARETDTPPESESPEPIEQKGRGRRGKRT